MALTHLVFHLCKYSFILKFQYILKTGWGVLFLFLFQVSVTQDVEVLQLSIKLNKFGENLTISVETNTSTPFSLDLAVKGCSKPVEVPTTTKPPVSLPGTTFTISPDLWYLYTRY